ncbi:hypothetical protein [Angustibacter aerolatus]
MQHASEPGDPRPVPRSAVDRPEAPAPGLRRLSGALLVVEALPAAAGAVIYLLQLLGGRAVVARNAAMLAALLALVTVVLLLVARALAAGRVGARGPAVTWQLVLIVVGCYAWAAPQRLAAVLVIAFAVATALVVVLTPRPPEDVPD